MDVAGGSRATPGLLTKRAAKILAARALEVGFSQSHLAAEVDISQAQMGRYLRGERVPNIEELKLICEVLGLDFLVDVLGPASGHS